MENIVKINPVGVWPERSLSTSVRTPDHWETSSQLGQLPSKFLSFLSFRMPPVYQAPSCGCPAASSSIGFVGLALCITGELRFREVSGEPPRGHTAEGAGAETSSPAIHEAEPRVFSSLLTSKSFFYCEGGGIGSPHTA